MTLPLFLFVLIVTVAFLFGLTTGFTNGGGLVATVITTRALEPMTALALVAVCEIAGVFLLGQAVSRTLANHLIVLPESASTVRILAVWASAFLGALIWNTGMWYLALPTSSSHAMIGGMAGAVLWEYGRLAVNWAVFAKIVIFLAIVPVLALLFAVLLARAVYWIGEFLTPAAKGFFHALEVLSLAGVAIAQGSNDGQKCVAMILVGLAALTQEPATPSLSLWPVLMLSGGAMALGLLFGSRRIIQTVGKGLYRIEPLQGFCAELATWVFVSFSSISGYPMSTTQVMSTAVLGAGVAVQPRDIRWNLVGEIGVAWLVTLPAAAALAAAFVWLSRFLIR